MQFAEDDHPRPAEVAVGQIRDELSPHHALILTELQIESLQTLFELTYDLFISSPGIVLNSPNVDICRLRGPYGEPRLKIIYLTKVIDRAMLVSWMS